MSHQRPIALVAAGILILLGLLGWVLRHAGANNQVTRKTTVEKVPDLTLSVPSADKSRASASAEDQATVTLIAVSAASGTPISGVDLRFQDDDHLLKLGQTRADGRVVTAKIGAIPGRIIGTLSGWQTSILEFQPHQTAEISLLMNEAVSIEGTASWFDGQPAPVGTVILALDPNKQYPSHLRPFLADDGVPPRGARTREDGHFTIADLPASEDVYIQAFGPSCMSSTDHPRLTHVPSLDAKVALYGLHALSVEVRDESGGFLRTAGSIFPESGGWMCNDPLSLEQVRAGDARLELLGLAPRSPGPERYQLFAYLRKSRPEVLGPITLTESCPGYESQTLQLMVPPFSIPVASQVVKMKEVASGWGALMIQFIGSSTVVQHSSAVTIGTIHFYDAKSIGGDAQLENSFEVGVFSLNAPLTLEEIPFGSYEWRFVTESSLFAFPPTAEPMSTIDIGAHESTIQVPLQQLGSLCVEVSGPDGKPYTDALSLSLSAARTSLPAVFRAAPYCLEGLASGTYVVVGKNKKVPIAEQEVTITAGQQSSLRLVIQK